MSFISQRSVAADNVTRSVVKVLVAANNMDYYRPWQAHGLRSSSGSGVIINGDQILTNAHVVADHTFIQVKKEADPKKYTARVLDKGYDCDLALLTVDDKSFFEGTTSLEFGELPKLLDAVNVIGYPQGGGKISITEGVVSRIEVISYSQSSRKLLTVQIDAAINPGNSGGPVVLNGKLVGIAMQTLKSGQNIGYIIPMPIIDHFFKDLEDGEYEGFPIMGIDYNNTENVHLREFYQLPEDQGGVLITYVLPNAPVYSVLKRGDVILEIDDVPIGEDGTFQFADVGRLSLPHLITQKQVSDEIQMKIVRDGEIKNVSVKLDLFDILVPYPHHFEKPSYYIFGGLVFTILSTDLLRSWGKRWWDSSPLDLKYYLMGSGRLNLGEKKDLVVLLNVLSDDVNVGYHGFGNVIITKVNDQEFKSFREFVEIINKDKLNQPYTIIDTERQARIIIHNENIDETDQEIIKRNNIPSQYSADVAGWLGKSHM